MEIQLNPMSEAQQRGIQRAVALIEANFTSSLNRKEMARAAGMSVSYFSKLFTQYLGLSRTNTWCVAGCGTPGSSCRRLRNSSRSWRWRANPVLPIRRISADIFGAPTV